MPVALTDAIRRHIAEQITKGCSLVEIAVNNNLSYCTVRKISKRFKQEGIQGLTPRYNHCGRTASKGDRFFYRATGWLKRLHPDWGAALIRLIMQERYTDVVLPAERTLQRWFKAQGLHRIKSRLALPALTWAQQVHDVWQIDAKEQFHLACTQKACYLTIVDEKSGCLLKASVFPPL